MHIFLNLITAAWFKHARIASRTELFRVFTGRMLSLATFNSWSVPQTVANLALDLLVLGNLIDPMTRTKVSEPSFSNLFLSLMLIVPILTLSWTSAVIAERWPEVFNLMLSISSWHDGATSCSLSRSAVTSASSSVASLVNCSMTAGERLDKSLTVMLTNDELINRVDKLSFRSLSSTFLISSSSVELDGSFLWSLWFLLVGENRCWGWLGKVW